MNQKQIVKLSLIAFSVIILCSCSLVEMSGTMTKKTGEVMEDYSQKHDGFIGKMAGFGGKIQIAVGSTVENIAKPGASEDLGETKTEQFNEANKVVWNSAMDAASNKEHNELNTVLEAQKRLRLLGYDPGPADGIMGNKTRIAIGEYQHTENLNFTKSLDKETLSSLRVNTSE